MPQKWNTDEMQGANTYGKRKGHVNYKTEITELSK